VTRAVAVHHVRDGPEDAPALVLLPALGSALTMWGDAVAALRAELHVVRVDLRGHGRSPVPPGPYELADLGADVVALLDRLGLERTHLLGLDLGGMTAMWLAVHAPERVDRLALCSTSTRLGAPRWWEKRAAIVREHGTKAVADAVVSRWVTPGFATAHRACIRRLCAMVAATPAEGYAACCEAIGRMAIEDELHRIAAPTFIIAAGDDRATPPDHAAHIAARIPGARMAVIAGAAHLATVERPDRIARLVLRHLRGTP
jgi:3-oxoadipate enol-lactonase